MRSYLNIAHPEPAPELVSPLRYDHSRRKDKDADVGRHPLEHGVGPPLMLVTGLSGPKSSWAAQLPLLSAQWRWLAQSNGFLTDGAQSAPRVFDQP